MVDSFPYNDFNTDADNSKETDGKDSDDGDDDNDDGYGECNDGDDDNNDDNDEDDDEYSLMLTHCSSSAGAGLQRARVQL